MITMILAVDENNGIGKNNDLPWGFIKEDMAWFRKHTLNKTVVMGRNTWDSLPEHSRPLKDRNNVVLTHSSKISKNYHDHEELPYDAITPEQIVDVLDNEDIFIIGGATTFKMFKHLCNRLLLSRIPGSYDCDTFFNIYEEFDALTLIEKHDTINVTFEVYKIK